MYPYSPGKPNIISRKDSPFLSRHGISFEPAIFTLFRHTVILISHQLQFVIFRWFVTIKCYISLGRNTNKDKLFLHLTPLGNIAHKAVIRDSHPLPHLPLNNWLKRKWNVWLKWKFFWGKKTKKKTDDLRKCSTFSIPTCWKLLFYFHNNSIASL